MPVRDEGFGQGVAGVQCLDVFIAEYARPYRDHMLVGGHSAGQLSTLANRPGVAAGGVQGVGVFGAE